MDTLTGDEPEALRIKSKTPRWSVTLADKRPLEVTFNDGFAAIALHIKTLKYKDRQFHGGFKISTSYVLNKPSGGPRFARQGEVSVEAESATASVEDTNEAIELLKAKFAGIFLPELTFGGLASSSDDLFSKLNKLSLIELNGKDGWLVAGYQLPGHEVRLVSHQPSPPPAARITKDDLDKAEVWLTKSAEKNEAAKKFLPQSGRVSLMAVRSRCRVVRRSCWSGRW
jgi:hypothetical protein